MAETRKDDTIIEFTFGLDEPEAEDAERLKFATNLLKDLKRLDEVERAERAEDPNPEAGAKAGWATLVGILKTEIKLKHFTAVLGWLGSRIQNKPIKARIKIGEKEATFEVAGPEQLPELEKTALKLIEAMSED